MKRALLVLICICAGVSVASAQTTTIAPRPVSAPEIDWTAAGSALIALAGVVAIVRGRRRG
jgi:hypothetical protein